MVNLTIIHGNCERSEYFPQSYFFVHHQNTKRLLVTLIYFVPLSGNFHILTRLNDPFLSNGRIVLRYQTFFLHRKNSLYRGNDTKKNERLQVPT